MGCDGGTIPRRDELVRLKKKPEKKDKDSERQFRWKHCALTQLRLQLPIVICALGRLYSKQNVIEALLDKEKMPESCAHIKSLKDIKNLNLTPNPAYDESKDDKSSPFICGLIGLEMSGQFRFVALWSCGCVFSERSLKEIKGKTCPLCQTPFTDEDIIVLNGTEDDIDQMRVKMEARNARLKLEKKSKAEKKSKSKEVAPPATVTSAEASGSAEARSSKSSLKPAVPNKRALISDKIGEDPVFKKSKDDYSVAKDPKASDVYKSLFTSHESEKDQKRAHWVTYNPFYN
ncbi:replication termination factor 2 isoform X2 [Anopheles ziemanni]|uniref:replication termination factor 2 isoform X2 n=1 Tax=Anopheles coustani TaxID=139045 RepID=UPI00265A9A00|nr:replication termination factor 2 isoform X2 [Anopheles coustani]XP_058179029.1 replication termination factor 2 isoform X2 [Anopheles ziemanni]